MKDEKTTSQVTSQLNARIATNTQYGSIDFDQWLFDRLPIGPSQRVLDVGCGVGTHLIKLAGLFANGEYHGIDISPQSISTAHERANRQGLNIKFRSGDASIASTLPNKYFDLIMSIYALYYTENCTSILELLSAKLRSEGHLAIMSPYKANNREWYDFLGEFMTVPNAVEAIADSFMDERVVPFLERHFRSLRLFPFENRISIPSFEALYQYWKSNIYHRQDCDEAFANYARRHFAQHDKFELTKRALLVIA